MSRKQFEAFGEYAEPRALVVICEIDPAYPEAVVGRTRSTWHARLVAMPNTSVVDLMALIALRELRAQKSILGAWASIPTDIEKSVPTAGYRLAPKNECVLTGAGRVTAKPKWSQTVAPEW